MLIKNNSKKSAKINKCHFIVDVTELTAVNLIKFFI